jgi:hypothetical protein
MPLVVVDYSEKAIAVFGSVNDASSKAALESKGGKFNPSLKGGSDKSQAGFIFPKSRKAEITAFVESLKDLPPGEPVPKAKKPVEEKSVDNKLLSSLLMRLERAETEIACLKQIVFASKSVPAPQEDDDESSDSWSDDEPKPRTLKCVKKL